MKKLWCFMGIFALFFLTLSDNAFCKSSENKAECQRWCDTNKPACVFCDSDAFCGGKKHEARKYDIIKSFKKGTGNWYACGLSEYERESLKNKNDCLQWCGQHKQDLECRNCADHAGCGIYHSIKKFGGRGENWHACGPNEYDRESKKNQSECEQWCENNPDYCDFCADFGCSYMAKLNGDRVKTFGGKGRNYHACRYKTNSLFAKARLEECEKLCKESDICDYCTTKSCGASVKTVGTFRGKGSTVYACKHR